MATYNNSSSNKNKYRAVETGLETQCLRYKYGVSHGGTLVTYFNKADDIIKFSQHTLVKFITRYNGHKYKHMCLYDWSWFDGVRASTIIKHYYGSIDDYGFNPIDNDDSKLIKHFNPE